MNNTMHAAAVPQLCILMTSIYFMRVNSCTLSTARWVAASALPRACPTAGIEYVNVECSLRMVSMAIRARACRQPMWRLRAGCNPCWVCGHCMLVLDSCMLGRITDELHEQVCIQI